MFMSSNIVIHDIYICVYIYIYICIYICIYIYCNYFEP